MKGPFGTLGVTKGPFGASGAAPLANQPTASGVFPDARAGRKMVAGASARGHLVVPRVLAIFESASMTVLKVPLATCPSGGDVARVPFATQADPLGGPS